MTSTLDNRGAQISISTRAGIDVLFDIGVDDASGNPMDITSYTAIAVLDDGRTQHALEADITDVDTISVKIDATLTAALPSVSRYSIELVGVDGLRASLMYGTVTCDRTFP